MRIKHWAKAAIIGFLLKFYPVTLMCCLAVNKAAIDDDENDDDDDYDDDDGEKIIGTVSMMTMHYYCFDLDLLYIFKYIYIDSIFI